MIYTLESEYSQGQYIQWIEAVKRTGLPFENLLWNLTSNSKVIDLPSFLEIQENIDKINSKITNDDYLLVDAAFIHGGSSIELEYYDNWTNGLYHINKINAKKIIIFYQDMGFSYENNPNDKIQVITPLYDISKQVDIENNFNYYLFNAGYSNYRWLSQMVFEQYPHIVRYKKFLSYNGYVKSHRTLLYHLLKKGNLLNEFFYSNIAYNVYNGEGRYIGNEDEISFDNQMLSVFGDEIFNTISKEEYDDIIKKDFPIVLDSTGYSHQYALVLPYTCNSYIEVVCATAFLSDAQSFKEIYTSEKIYKPFLSFQIPIYLGQPFLCKTLKQLGFDLFEDLIDISYDTDLNDLNRIKMVYENINNISKMSNIDLHKYYQSNTDRLLNNFNKLRELSNKQIEHLKNILK